jgi:hypothetical protein
VHGAKGLLRSAPPMERGEPWPRTAQTSLYVDTLPAVIVRIKSNRPMVRRDPFSGFGTESLALGAGQGEVDATLSR